MFYCTVELTVPPGTDKASGNNYPGGQGTMRVRLNDAKSMAAGATDAESVATRLEGTLVANSVKEESK